MSYRRFGTMIAVSTIVMFGLMYLNTYRLDHVFYSQARTSMAVTMGAAMAVIMLGFMLGMYRNRRANIAILAGSVVVFAAALWLVRSQRTVGDVAWMEAMIPHHSIAILTSTRAHLRPPRARPRRPDHRSAAAGDRRDGGAGRRSAPEPRPGGRRRAAAAPTRVTAARRFFLASRPGPT